MISTKAISLPIYMDANATTPLDPRVRQAIEPFLGESFGNAASQSHAYGWQAQQAVREARAHVAALLNCSPTHVLWTSGATESNNMAILGVAKAFKGEAPHIVTQATEHKAVLEVCAAAAEWGAEVTVLPVDHDGRIRLSDLRAAILPRTVLVSIMLANNEIGTLQPIQEIADICHSQGIIFHTDAAQGAGKVAIDLATCPIDLLSISAHKIYGPKGVGALIYRPINRPFELKPISFGGDQEKGLRPGTVNVAGVVGLGEACRLAQSELEHERTRLCSFQNGIFALIRKRFPQVQVNGSLEHRLANNISLSFPDLPPDEMTLSLSGIAYSSGSACTSASGRPSHVLKAIGHDDTLARSTLRLGLGRFTGADDVSFVTDKLLKMLENVYSSQPTQVHLDL